MKAINVYIGGKLKDFREMGNMTQTDLANVIGVTRGSIANMERGGQGIPIDKLSSFAIYFGLELSEFLPTTEWLRKNKDKQVRRVITYEIIT